MKQARPYPVVGISKRAAQRQRGGHPWVFEGEVTSVSPCPMDGREAANGDVVDVVDPSGTYLGTGLLSLESKIRVRIVSRNANDRFDEGFWRRKVEWAWAHRKATMGHGDACHPDVACCRVIFSEADGFPGLIVDRYESTLVAQVGTVGMDRLRSVIYPLVLDVLARDGIEVTGIYERGDSPSRTKEGLPLTKGWYGEGLAQERVTPSTKLVVRENDVAYEVDVENSQKTGFFLDQKFNRRAVARLAQGRRVLDCYCHVGSFGLNAIAGDASFARCVDISQTALDLAAGNARLNGFDDRMAFTCADVKHYLPELASNRAALAEQGGPFDLIVLDPPAFTKSRQAVAHAQKGYEEINYLAMSVLPRGGYLATCSCSHFMTTELLRDAIAHAARRANVEVKQVEARQQAPDHPILWDVPETHYLDFFVLQII